MMQKWSFSLFLFVVLMFMTSQEVHAKDFLKPDQAAFWYSGHVLFDKEEFAVEGYWDIHKDKSTFFARKYLFTGLGFTTDFLFYEFPVGIGTDIFTIRWSDFSAGMGISLVNSAVTTGNTFGLVPPRIVFNFPFVFRKLETVLEYSLNFGHSAMKWGLGFKYEF